VEAVYSHIHKGEHVRHREGFLQGRIRRGMFVRCYTHINIIESCDIMEILRIPLHKKIPATPSAALPLFSNNQQLKHCKEVAFLRTGGGTACGFNFQMPFTPSFAWFYSYSGFYPHVFLFFFYNPVAAPSFCVLPNAFINPSLFETSSLVTLQPLNLPFAT